MTQEKNHLHSNHLVFGSQKYFEANKIEGLMKLSFGEKDIYFSRIDKTAVAIPKAPYADIGNFAGNDNVVGLLSTLKPEGFENIEIKLLPDFIDTTNHEQWHDSLKKQGFSVVHETNHHVDLQSVKMHKMQIRRAKKCENHGCTFSEINRGFDDIYTFLQSCREQQGLQMNLDRRHFERLLLNYSEIYRCYVVRDVNGEIMACLVSVIVNNTIIYNFLPAFDRRFSSFSPLSYLYQQLYEQLKEESFHYLDLGISSINGVKQNNLIKYKESIGGQLSIRNNYFKKL